METSASALSNWDQVREDLAEYAHPVLSVWIGNGTIFGRVRHIAHIALHSAQDLSRDPDAATELAGTTVAVSLKAFHQALRADAWKPGRGASLGTFFVGHCLFHFPNEYRRWVREHRTGLAPGNPLDIASVDIQDPRADPAYHTALYLDALALLARAPGKTRTALAYSAMGYSHTDIAKIEKGTPKSVEMLIRRYRQVARRSGQAMGI
jgi:DNA-directed RNA polymerase specialized sigma24 family protein